MLTGKPFALEIVTPEGIVFEGMVEMVQVPGTLGPFQVLYGHAPIISELDIGITRFNDSEDNESIWATSSGFAQFFHNKMTLVVETAEDATTIDIQRALAAKRRAEALLAKKEAVDFHRAQISLLKALNRLKAAQLVGRYHG